MVARAIDCSDFSDKTINDRILYPVDSVYHAISIVRMGNPVGRIGSIIPKPDKIQISTGTESTVFMHPYNGGQVELHSSLHGEQLFTVCLMALKRTLMHHNRYHRAAFEARYIGRSITSSDTGDYKVLSIAEIARELGRDRSTVEKWIRRTRDEFSQQLIKMGLMAPESADYQ